MPLPALKQHCTTVYFDTRDSGKLTGPTDEKQYKPDNFVADIEALRVYLTQGAICVAEHSSNSHQVLAIALGALNYLLGIMTVDAIAADVARGEEKFDYGQCPRKPSLLRWLKQF
jgi:proline iminopeptidase